MRVLQFPQWDNLFYIETDASHVGLREALSQYQGLYIRLPVSYAFRNLHDAKRRYSATSGRNLLSSGRSTSSILISWECLSPW